MAAVALAGTPAIVLELLHPAVMAGVHDLSGYREDGDLPQPDDDAPQTAFVEPKLIVRHSTVAG